MLRLPLIHRYGQPFARTDPDSYVSAPSAPPESEVQTNGPVSADKWSNRCGTAMCPRQTCKALNA